MSFQSRFDSFVSSKLPRLKDVAVSNRGHVVAEPTIAITKSDLQIVQESIQSFHKLRDIIFKNKSGYKPPNNSVLMSYDFHLTPDGPKLIEINTNAGLSLYAYYLYLFKNEPMEFLEVDYRKGLENSFKEESRHFHFDKVNCAIVDHQPTAQFFYPEFLMMADWMEAWGWSADVLDARDLRWKSDRLVFNENTYNFIYNRLTDFYLKDHEDLYQAFVSGSVCFSPNPNEYDLLANKSRLIEFSNPSFLKSHLGDCEAIRRVLPITRLVKETPPEEIRKDKKRLFFKPLTSFGGKGVYRGATMTNSVLERVLSEDYLAQEYFPAPKLKWNTELGEIEFKYDIRFITYRDKIQMIFGRAYEGQVTNFRTPGSGICTVSIA